MFRGSLSSRGGGHSAPSSGDEVPTGDLFAVLDAANISPSVGPAEMSKFQYVASYNWLDSSEPIILVPGLSYPYQNSRLTEKQLLMFHTAKVLLQFGLLQPNVESFNQTKAKYSSITMLHVTVHSRWSQCFVPCMSCILSSI
jgi:hypothetical protein